MKRTAGRLLELELIEDTVSSGSIMEQAGHTRQSAYSAVRWLLAGSIAQRVVSIIALAVIARLIDEDHFGIHRELLAFHAILFVLLPVGFDQLLARERAFASEYVQALRGALYTSALVIASLSVLFRVRLSQWLGIPAQHEWLLYVLPGIILLQAGKLRYKVPLAARLAYRSISSGEISNTLVAMSCSISLLIFWRSPGALYVGFAMGELSELLVLRRFRGNSGAGLYADVRAFGLLVRKNGWFSLLYCSDQVINAIGANAPVLVLGAALGHAAAAGFAMASSLIMLPLSLLVSALAKVALPALSGRTEPELHTRALQLITGGAAFIAPVLIGTAALAVPLVEVVLGAKWVEGTAPLLRWLAAYCVLVGVFSPVSAIDILRNRMDVGLAWNTATLGVRLWSLNWGRQHSIEYAVAAFSLASAAMWLLNAVVLGWLLRAGHWRFHRTWLRLLPCWVGIAGGCYASAWLSRYNPWLALGAAMVPALLYALALRRFFPDAWELLLRLSRLRHEAPPATPIGENSSGTPDHGVPVP